LKAQGLLAKYSIQRTYGLYNREMAANSGERAVKYCIHDSYLIAIIISKSQYIDNMVSASGLGVKKILG
jgi:hypothetical protein